MLFCSPVLYLLMLLVAVGHIVRPLFSTKKEDNDYDLVHFTVYLFFDLLAFLIPYYLGNWLNQLHCTYHEKMEEVYYQCVIEHNDCVSGSPCEKRYKAGMNCPPPATSGEEVPLLGCANDGQ